MNEITLEHGVFQPIFVGCQLISFQVAHSPQADRFSLLDTLQKHTVARPLCDGRASVRLLQKLCRRREAARLCVSEVCHSFNRHTVQYLARIISLLGLLLGTSAPDNLPMLANEFFSDVLFDVFVN